MQKIKIPGSNVDYCRDCKWFIPSGNDDQMGFCRRYPPHPFIMQTKAAPAPIIAPGQEQQAVQQGIVSNPIPVSEEFGCGEFA